MKTNENQIDEYNVKKKQWVKIKAEKKIVQNWTKLS